MEDSIEALKRKIKIKDEYIKLVLDLFVDYDGYYDEETKQGSIKGLAGLIDQNVDFLHRALASNDKTVVYFSGEKEFNILHEELEEVK